MKSICLILPYFGKFNNYFSLFLESCRRNPTVNWLIYTDCPAGHGFPENIRVVETTFEQFRRRFESHFDFAIALDRPYKLCDFKPAYGEVLADDLNGFDFWGHCDCDMIFGHLRDFLTDDILSAHTKIFSRGHLSVYHNDPETNSYYRRQTYLPIAKVYSDTNIYCFDEWGGISRAWVNDGLPLCDELVMDDIAAGFEGFHLTKELTGRYSPYKEYQTDLSGRYKKMKHILYSFREGELLRHWTEGGKAFSEPVLYTHFQKRAMKVGVPEDSAEFLIANDAFLPYEENPDAARIKKLAGSAFSLKNFSIKARRKAFDMMQLLTKK